jgi:P4 family phage/plasmid primase-like protien
MTTSALNSPKDYALYYQDSEELGFSVFVLQNPEDGGRTEEQLKARKKPAVLWDLYQIMRPSKIQIERWFAKNPNYNVAVATGNISNNIIAFDVDGPAAKKRVEEKRLEMSTNLRVALDNTMLNRTGSGGIHIIFRLAEPTSISQKVLWSDGQAHSQILMQGNGHYLVMPPSRHPNGNRYEWNGKAPHLITTQELNEFILLFSPSTLNPRQKKEEEEVVVVPRPSPSILQQKGLDPNRVNLHERTLSTDNMQELLSWIKPYYTPGSRDHTIFYLSGMMRKNGGYSLDSARMFVKLLCNASGYPDEDLDKSLTVVDNTYRKPLDELNGKSGLYDLVVKSYETANREEYLARSEAFRQICQITNSRSEPSKPVNADGNDKERDDNNNNSDSNFLGGDHNEPGVWLSRQIAVDKNLDVISTLANEAMRVNRFKTLTDTKEILWNNNGTYLPKGEDRITMVLENLGGYHVSSHIRAEVIEHIKARTLIDRSEFDKDIHLVNVKNCVIDLRSGECLPHDPEKYLFTQQLPIDYKPNDMRTCRKILDFLYNIMHPSDVPLVIEFIGYCLIRDSRFQKALMVAGAPDSGKSTFLFLLLAFFGKLNITTKTMQQLTENRFATASLFGKLANIFADLSSRRLREVEMFKVLVSGDQISAERKFKPDFEFTPYAKLIFSANLPPLPPDNLEDEDAFYKRWLVVSFNLRKNCIFCGEKIEKDVKLLEKLTTDEELSGLLYLAVVAAQRLLLKGRFTKSPDIETVKEEYERKANPVKAWASARCILYEEYETDKDRIQEDFEDYCYRSKLPAFNRVHLARELTSLYNVRDVKKGPRGNQKHMWKGVALRKDLRASGQLDLGLYGDTDELKDE